MNRRELIVGIGARRRGLSMHGGNNASGFAGSAR